MCEANICGLNLHFFFRTKPTICIAAVFKVPSEESLQTPLMLQNRKDEVIMRSGLHNIGVREGGRKKKKP